MVTLPETNITPENGWLEYYFPIGDGRFSGAMLVSGRVIVGLGPLVVWDSNRGTPK